MRGKVANNYFSIIPAGITPAHAGKSIFLSPYHSSLWDHPRPCGEKPLHAWICLPFLGSPPPMRGKVIVFITIVPIIRITPAHAGKSWQWPRAFAIRQDHPRPCGEKVNCRATVS